MNTEAETLETRRQHVDAALAHSEGEASSVVTEARASCGGTKADAQETWDHMRTQTWPHCWELTVSSGKAGDSNEAEEFSHCGGAAA